MTMFTEYDNKRRDIIFQKLGELMLLAQIAELWFMHNYLCKTVSVMSFGNLSFLNLG